MMSGNTHVTVGHDLIIDWTEEGIKVNGPDDIPMIEIEAGVKASYLFEKGEVYVGLSYHHDAPDWFTDNVYVAEDNNNRVKIGVIYNVAEKVTVNVEGQSSVFHNDRSAYSLTAGLNYRF